MKKAANKIALIIVALLVVSLGVFSTINYTNTKENIYDLAKDTKTSSSKIVQFYMNAFFDSKIAEVEKFVRYLELNPDILEDKEKFKGVIMNAAQVTEFFEFYFGYANDGTTFSADVEGEGRKFSVLDQSTNFDARTRVWYKEAVAKGGVIFTEPYVGSAGVLNISIAKKVVVNGKVVGVLGADIALDKFDEELDKIKPTPSSAIALFDLEHKKIIHFVHKDLVLSDSSEAMKIIDDYSNEYKKNGDKTFTYNLRGTERVLACQHYEKANWLVCSANSWTDYDESLNKTFISQIISSIVFIVVIVALLLFVVSRSLKPLSAISESLVSFFKFLNYEIKEPVITEVKTKDEFGVMSRLINDNIKKIQDTANQDATAVNQSVATAKEIESGNLKARITQNPANPKLVELKDVLNKMLDVLEVKVGSDLNVIQKVFDSYRRSDFTSRIENANGEVEKVTNTLGIEISKMLNDNLNQAQVLEEK
ncbi:cache domain-containing protein, partial [uncultured Campylobacter sp.]|uniref:cache domain-containing protein n=1 Tax=uncultured Campylobacter sp. TaxID=218934 RepID=UPI002623ADD8